MSNYWQRHGVNLKGWPLPSVIPRGPADIPAAWDRLSRMLFYTTPRQLDRVRANRNRYPTIVRP